MSLHPANRAVRLTPPGSSALAVVRLIGPNVDAFLAQHFSRAVPPDRAVHGTLSRGDDTVDDPVIVRTSPMSIDISLHGSPWIVDTVLSLASAMGFAIDTELSADHFPDADGLWADVLASLPKARTPLAVQALLAQPEAWSKAKPSPDDRTLFTLLSLPTIAIVGPANVGKSTLANALFGQERSIVADLPGTTRDWVGGTADIGGLAVTLIDTPGQRATNDAIERAAQAASAGPVASADLVIVVLDHSTELGRTERALIDRHRDGLRVANKSDRSALWNATEVNAIETVATRDIGVEPLRRAILNHFGCEKVDVHVARMWLDSQRP